MCMAMHAGALNSPTLYFGDGATVLDSVLDQSTQLTVFVLPFGPQG